jgi:hypothetical protein
MKKILFGFFLVSLFVPSVSFAQNVEVKRSSYTYARSSVASPRVQKVTSGQTYEIIGSNKYWVKINIQGKNAWLLKRNVDFLDEPSNLLKETRKQLSETTRLLEEIRGNTSKPTLTEIAINPAKKVNEIGQVPFVRAEYESVSYVVPSERFKFYFDGKIYTGRGTIDNLLPNTNYTYRWIYSENNYEPTEFTDKVVTLGINEASNCKEININPETLVNKERVLRFYSGNNAPTQTDFTVNFKCYAPYSNLESIDLQVTNPTNSDVNLLRFHYNGRELDEVIPANTSKTYTLELSGSEDQGELRFTYLYNLDLPIKFLNLRLTDRHGIKHIR